MNSQNKQTGLREFCTKHLYEKIVINLLGFNRYKVSKEIFIILSIIMLTKIFFFEIFKIPSGSMHPGLHESDWLIASKLSFGYSFYSFTMPIFMMVNFICLLFSMFLPKGNPIYFLVALFINITAYYDKDHIVHDNVYLFGKFNSKIMETKPQRGDITIFRPDENNKQYWVKRVIGIPGDTIQLKDGIVYVNDEKVSITNDGKYEYKDFEMDGSLIDDKTIADLYTEENIDGRRYQIAHDMPLGLFDGDNTMKITLQKDKYFVMGITEQNHGTAGLWGLLIKKIL